MKVKILKMVLLILFMNLMPVLPSNAKEKFKPTVNKVIVKKQVKEKHDAKDTDNHLINPYSPSYYNESFFYTKTTKDIPITYKAKYIKR